jgi:hypothetical protein
MEGAQPRAESVLYGNGERSQRREFRVKKQGWV